MSRINKLLLRLKVCYKVLFSRYWLVISLTDDHLENILSDKPFELEAEQLGLRKYIINKMIYGISENIDEYSLLLNKMEFDAEAEEWGKKL